MSESLEARIALLEQHVDWLYAQSGREGPYGTQYATPAPAQPQEATGQDWPYPVSARVLETLRRGVLIQAIKEHREETGLGLAEAKRVVESANAMLR